MHADWPCQSGGLAVVRLPAAVAARRELVVEFWISCVLRHAMTKSHCCKPACYLTADDSKEADALHALPFFCCLPTSRLSMSCLGMGWLMNEVKSHVSTESAMPRSITKSKHSRLMSQILFWLGAACHHIVYKYYSNQLLRLEASLSKKCKHWQQAGCHVAHSSATTKSKQCKHTSCWGPTAYTV